MSVYHDVGAERCEIVFLIGQFNAEHTEFILHFLFTSSDRFSVGLYYLVGHNAQSGKMCVLVLLHVY